MINIIGLDETDALLIKKALKDLDCKFESEEELDNRNVQDERNRIDKIIFELNTKFNYCNYESI